MMREASGLSARNGGIGKPSGRGGVKDKNKNRTPAERGQTRSKAASAVPSGGKKKKDSFS